MFLKGTIIHALFTSLFRWETWLGKVFYVALMISFAWFVSTGIEDSGAAYGVIWIVSILGGAVAFASSVNINFGLRLTLAWAFFLNVFKKIIFAFGFGGNVPLGLGVNMLLLAAFFGLIVKELMKKETNWSGFLNPIIAAFVIDLVFTVISALNPAGPGFGAWMQYGFRSITFNSMLLVVTFAHFKSYRNILSFTNFWLTLIFINSLYTMIQKHIGLPIWDYKYLHSDPVIYKMNFINGRFRLAGMMGDVSEAGLIAAYASIVLMVLIIYAKTNKKRAKLGVVLLLVLLSMSYAGTRTAFAVTAAGMVFIGLVNIRKKLTILAAVGGLFLFLAILYVPTSNAQIKRIRSTFAPDDDPSYQVRKATWARVQPWIRSRPIGGGIGSHGPLNPEKEEADSGYVALAIEQGWIGLGIKLTMYGTVMVYGIAAFFRSKKRAFKMLYLAYISGFFTMSVAHLPQNAFDKWPSYIIILSSFMIIVKLKEIEFPNTKTTSPV